MTPLPERRPKKLSLGPLERELLEIVWELGTVTSKAVHDRILDDPDRELAYASVLALDDRAIFTTAVIVIYYRHRRNLDGSPGSDGGEMGGLGQLSTRDRFCDRDLLLVVETSLGYRTDSPPLPHLSDRRCGWYSHPLLRFNHTL